MKFMERELHKKMKQVVEGERKREREEFMINGIDL